MAIKKEDLIDWINENFKDNFVAEVFIELEELDTEKHSKRFKSFN